MRVFFIPLIVAVVVSSANAQIENDSLKAVRLIATAENYVREHSKDSAVDHFLEGAKLFRKLQLWEQEARAYNRMSTIHWRTQAFTAALSAAKDAERICVERLPPNHREVIEVYNNFGAAYYFSGQFTPSLHYYHKALELQRQVYGNVHSEVANSCNYIGVLNWELGNSVEALKYHQQSLIIRKQVLRENHPYLGYSYSNIGLIYRIQDKPEEALECFEKALDIARSNQGEGSLEFAGFLNNIASVFGDQGKLEQAIAYNKRACSIATKVLGELNTDVTLGYDNIASFYDRMSRPSDAFDYYNKSLDIRLKLLGPKHSSVARSYYRLAGLYAKLGNYGDAVDYYQKSLIAAIPAFNETATSINPETATCERQVFLLNVLRGKADAQVKQSGITGKPEQKMLALDTYLVADSLVDEVRKGRSNFEDKLDLSRTSLQLYEGALNLCLELLKDTGDDRFRERAFYFSERSRAGVLAEALSSAAAKLADALPYELIAAERKIRSEQSRVQTILRSNTRERDSLEAQAFLLDRRYDSLMIHIQENYPSHYRARYQRNYSSLTDIRKKLPGNALLIEFFEGKNSIYVFGLSRKTLQLEVIERDSVYDQSVNRFNKALMLKSLSDLNEKNFRDLTESGYTLYELLLRKVLMTQPETSQLIVIPHGQLAFIAFDAFLSRKPGENVRDYANLDYLIKNYAIQYGYSATLFSSNRKETLAAEKYLAFAPAYPEFDGDSSRLALLGKFRGSFTNLAWNQWEAQRVSNTLGAKTVAGSEATESRFKADASSTRMLHLAMHAFVDTDDPMNSKLVFAPETGSEEDGFLHAFELYNMDIHADLVVLSACSTGQGSLAEGEGVLNLARAFSFAGVMSIVMTHWNVDDKASSELMDLFYANLKEGKSKSAALREAKLTYLEGADPVHAHPFFWAAFASIGADTPLIENNSALRVVTLSSVLLVLGIAIALVTRKAKAGRTGRNLHVTTKNPISGI